MQKMSLAEWLNSESLEKRNSKNIITALSEIIWGETKKWKRRKILSQKKMRKSGLIKWWGLSNPLWRKRDFLYLPQQVDGILKISFYILHFGSNNEFLLICFSDSNEFTHFIMHSKIYQNKILLPLVTCCFLRKSFS